jgi:hypothetical protein
VDEVHAPVAECQHPRIGGDRRLDRRQQLRLEHLGRRDHAFRRPLDGVLVVPPRVRELPQPLQLRASAGPRITATASTLATSPLVRLADPTAAASWSPWRAT